MSIEAEKSDRRSVSELLSTIDLHGRTWCYTDLSGASGFTMPAGDMVSFHTVIHGSARIACIGGAVGELGAGDVVIVPTGEAHALRTIKESSAEKHQFLRSDNPVDIPPTIALGNGGSVGARLLSGRLDATWPDDIDRKLLPPLLRIRETDALLNPGALRQAGVGPGSTALLTRIAAMLLTSALRGQPNSHQLFTSNNPDPIAEALQLIEANPSANWTVEKLARSVSMGRSNFAARFTEAVGRTPMEVVASHRMHYAAALLQQGALKIAEIGEMAGYGSEAAFSRRFTRHFGVTPSDMRSKIRAEAERAADGNEVSTGAFRPLLRSRLVLDVLAREMQGRAGTERTARPRKEALDVLQKNRFLLRGSRD